VAALVVTVVSVEAAPQTRSLLVNQVVLVATLVALELEILLLKELVAAVAHISL
jgi:hypothetical protein